MTPPNLSNPSLSPHSAVTGGGCLCGHVRYQLARPPADGVWCHCRICQRASGAPAVLWAEVQRVDFQLTQGELRFFNSSAWARRGFCPHCGTPVVYDGAPDGVEDFGVAAATLDDPNQTPASAHIWTNSMRRGMILDPQLPRHREETPAFTAARAQARASHPSHPSNPS